MRAALACLALVLVAPSLVEAAAPSMRIVGSIGAAAIGPAVPLQEWTGKRLAMGDADGDGVLDLVAHNENHHVYVLDGKTGRALVEVKPRYPYGPDLGPFNGARLADLEADGKQELIVANRAAVVSVWTLEPREGGLHAKLRWDRHLKDLHGKPTADAAPVLGDLDGDGVLEIVVQTEERGTYALRADGSIHWVADKWGGNAEAVVRDVDGDGDLDVVVFTDGGVAYAVDGPTGKVLWEFDARRHHVWPGSAASAGLVEDLDGDGRVEVAYCTRNVENGTEEYASGAPLYADHHFGLFLIRGGKLVWTVKPWWGNPMCSAYLMAHDADGDGVKEIFGMDWNTIGHKPGKWERLGPAHVFSFGMDGRERWHTAVEAWDAKPPVAMADADGDGDQDVIAYDRWGLVAIDALTGRVVHRAGLGGAQMQQGPVIAQMAPGDWRGYIAVTRPDTLVEIALPSQATPPAWPGWERVVATGPVPKPATPAPVSPTPPVPTVVEPPAPATPTPQRQEPEPTPASPTPIEPVHTPVPGSGALLGVVGLVVAFLLRRGS